jgi:predicted molibdopterin-dependent oxidoreductase YjgC
MGNVLSALIPDMDIIREEGILNISDQLADQLKIISGDQVKIKTEFGEAIHKVKIEPDLNGSIAYFKTDWKSLSLFVNGINLNEDYISANIEKV